MAGKSRFLHQSYNLPLPVAQEVEKKNRKRMVIHKLKLRLIC